MTTTTLDPTIRPRIGRAALQLAKLVRQPRPGDEIDPTEADLLALSAQLIDDGPVDADTATVACCIREAMVCLADEIDPIGQNLEALRADALSLAAMADALHGIANDRRVI